MHSRFSLPLYIFQHWGVEHLKIVVWIQTFWPLAWCKCCPCLGLMGWMENLYIFLRFVKHCRSSPRTSQSEDVCLGWIWWMERHSSLSRSQSRLVVASRCNADDSLYAAFQTRFYNRAFLPGCTIAKHIEPSARIINPGSKQPRNINVETKSLIEESVVNWSSLFLSIKANEKCES